ncbi:MAG: phosphatase PAP2 family protein [Thermomicrobiales bacterium]|nr:phosphatase PAP2 family protein [Thermomicrobiales bacterium]
MPVPKRRITTEQRLGIIKVMLGLFFILYRLVRGHKTDKFDRAVTAAFQSQKNPAFSKVMHLVSWPGFPPQSRIIPWLLPIFWAITGRWTEAIVQLGGWGTGILSAIFKKRMKRPRPSRFDFYFAPANIGGTSFPSGHVINYIGVYGTFAYLAAFNIRWKPLRRLVLLGISALLALVGPSRIYLGHHWASDVTASYLLGSGYVVGLTGIYRFMKEREADLLEHHAAVEQPAEFEIVGHGGAGAFHYGNSKTAIESALRFPIERIELDVRISADRELVLVHDDLVVINGKKRPVEEITSAELRATLPDFLTFDEALALIDNRVPVMIDLKKGNFVPELIESIERNGLQDSAMISCTDPWAIRKLRDAFPHMPIGLSTGHRPVGFAVRSGGSLVRNIVQDFGATPLLAALRWSGASAVMMHHHLATPQLVQLLHDHDYVVYAWTVDNPARMKKVVAARVDGVISNRPDLVVDVTRNGR